MSAKGRGPFRSVSAPASFVAFRARPPKSGHLVDRAPRAVGFAWARKIVPVGECLRAEIDERSLAEPALAYRLFMRDSAGVGFMSQRWFRLDTDRTWIAGVLRLARRGLREAVAAANEARR